LLTVAFANPGDQDMAALLRSARVFAVVGASPKPDRPVFGVMRRLLDTGYEIVPVNPGQAGGSILGRKVYASLAEVPAPVDVVDIFRASDAALEVVTAAIAEKERLGLQAVWMQIGVVNENAARLAREAGLMVVMDRCPKIELARLGITRV
jgi:predicted CoA-binding protein